MNDSKSLNVSSNDWNGVFVPKHTAKLISQSFEDGTSPFIPVGGKLNPPFVYNVNTGFSPDAKDLIPLQLTKIAKGYSSNAVGTYSSMSKAGTRIKTGEKGLFFNFVGKDGEFHHSAYFFAEQTEQPERFLDFASKNFRRQQSLKGQTIKIESPNVEDFLSVYVASSRSGASIEVSQKVAKQFKKNLLEITSNELAKTEAEKNPKIPKLDDVLFKADKKAKEIVKSLEKENGLGPLQQKNQGHKRAKAMER